MPDEVKSEAVAVAALAPPAVNSPEALAAVFGTTESLAYCTFDPKTPAGRRLLDLCEEAPTQKLIEAANVKFRLVHVYAHQVDLTDKDTGETYPATRICLCDDQDKVYSCVSLGVKKAIVRLVRQHGLPPWPKGIPVQVSLRRLGENRQWLTLLNDEPAPTPKGAK